MTMRFPIIAGCLYLAAAAWQSLHPCRHPPSASSPALWSVSPRRSLRPPSYFSLFGAPLLKCRGKNGSRVPGDRLLSDRCRQLRSWCVNRLQQILENVWAFSRLRRGFRASPAHLTQEGQWRARTRGVLGQGERCEEKQTYNSGGVI